MKEFIAAVKPELIDNPDDEIAFVHEGAEVLFYQPSTGQLAIMMGMGGRAMDVKVAGTFIELFFEMMDDDTQRHFRTRLMDRRDGFDLDSENGIFDIFEALVEEWSGNPTKKPTDFQPPRRATGRKSTATTRVKASTSSTSRSRATST